MTTCTWNFRRHAVRILVAASTVAAGAGYSVGANASADQLSSLRAQAQTLAARIQTLGQQEGALGEQYDAATLAAQTANAKVASATTALAAADAATAKARGALSAEALDAYTGGGTTRALQGASTLGTATASLLGAEYVDSLAASQRDALDQYRLAAVQDKTAKATLQQALVAAQAQVAQVSKARQDVAATQSQLQGAYQQDQGQIATLVAQIQAQQAAAAAAAAQAAAQQRAAQQAQQLAAQQAAASAAARASTQAAPAVSRGGTTSGGRGPAAPSNPAPPPGAGASGAVSAALTRLGDPYVWGASGPSTFDCSGLVMWAYEQVGISLPHYSGAQFADGIHISMSQLQPGDLVFPSDPGEHVAMYIGGGNIVEAPYTGATVHVVPLSSWFVQAVRIG
ncbi:C40 family peptidase [Acidiferrimicrobium sp. IK]|uniref:C40 family peptidase n=1 Tax=Acidiferrimicrobium sp. IK TaxID=2871700 RepID=UPI0021CB21DE|nr:C40 family peptidase [Acidiferrimicrobium sp. IK]MCU4184250.1 C40 family peptidase [Acidiferrimicrobium sp. IK]